MRTNNIPEHNRLGLVTLPKSESDQYTEGELRETEKGKERRQSMDYLQREHTTQSAFWVSRFSVSSEL